MIGGILRAAIDIGDDCLVGVQFPKHPTLKGKTTLLGFDACPCVSVRFFPVTSAFGVAVQLGVIGVVSDGPGVPDVGMLPGGFADGESGLVRPSFHAAAPPLADDGNVIPRRSEQCTRTKKLQRLARARAKRVTSPNFDAIDNFSPPATEDIHESGIGTMVE